MSHDGQDGGDDDDDDDDGGQDDITNKTCFMIIRA